jgi:hypothetical protein
MPTLASMLDVETEIESAFDSFLSGSPYSLAASPSDTDTQLETPRFDIVATKVAEGPHQFTLSSPYTGRRIYDQYRVRVDISLTYDPSYNQAQGTLRSRFRLAMTDYAGIQAKLTSNAYLILAPDTFRQTDGSRSIDDENKQETITAAMEGVFFLNPTTLGSVS